MEDTVIKERILDYLFEYGKTCIYCGKHIGTIAKDLDIPIDKATSLMNTLFKENRIIVRQSTSGPVSFLNYSKYEKIPSNT